MLVSILFSNTPDAERTVKLESIGGSKEVIYILNIVPITVSVPSGLPSFQFTIISLYASDSQTFNNCGPLIGGRCMCGPPS
jgi:hypothetical protein